jgi:hypothetical protein
MHRLTLLLLFLLSTAITARPQRIATLTVDLSRPMSGIAAPASIDLDSLTDLPVSSLGLQLRTGGTINFSVPCPVTLLAYRYGGLGWRATPEWNRDNSEVLTSEGMDRRHADNSKARWCIVQGALGNDYGGVAMLSHPDNYNHPEPLRIWPDSSNGHGDLFANFSPTKDRDWLLEPGYTLRYRWVVFNGHFTKQQAESAWQYFSNPPHVNVDK